MMKHLKYIRYQSKRIRAPLMKLRSIINSIIFYGNNRYCPVCERYSRKFGKAGITSKRDSARCLRCGSVERYRFIWLYLQKETDLFNVDKSKRVLHIAPEACFEGKLKKYLGDGYITADLNDPRVDEKMDITDIHHPDETFDVVCCNHVLEHISNDRKAIHQLYRILKKHGWAIISVPITAPKTLEDPSIIDPIKRFEVFGQHDHVRRYGPDFINRLKETGFIVKTISPIDIYANEEILFMGMNEPCGVIYHCFKNKRGT